MAKQHVFAGAHGHVESWTPKQWHSGIAQPHSSQGLCVSVWGTLASYRGRTRILRDLFEAAGLVVEGLEAPSIRCEAGAKGELAQWLNETGANATPTCVDALIEWSAGVVCVESKLLETSFGTCSQVVPQGGQPAACAGTYGCGSDLKTLSRAPCRLQVWDRTRAPRLYWQIAWDLFRPDVLEPRGGACPFAGPSFQLMRNLALATALVRSKGRGSASVLVMHAAAARHAARHVDEVDAFRALLLDDVKLRVQIATYESFADLLRDHRLRDLADEIDRRIAGATATR